MKLPHTFRMFRSAAFTLIEILVVAVLLTVIILGLLGMFQQTQKAFRVGMTQTDVLESGRATTQLLARELELIRPANGSAVNFFAWIPFPRQEQALPAISLKRTNYFEEMFFLTRSNQYWIGIGYRVGGSAIGSGIGSLYRYETSCHINATRPQFTVDQMLQDFFNRPFTNLSRIADGVVHFKIQPYDMKGFLLTNVIQLSAASSANACIAFDDPPPGCAPRSYPPPYVIPGQVYYCMLSNNVVPAFVDFELAILEPRAQERVRALNDVPGSAAADYLAQQAGRVHVFRQRATVRNVDPSVYP